MTHEQMSNSGFELVEGPGPAIYTFQNIYFIPKEGIDKVRRPQIMLGIYNAGMKQGFITGQNQRQNGSKKIRRFRGL